MKNRRSYFIVVFLIFLFSISAVVYIVMLEKTEKQLLVEKYANNAKNLQNRIHDNIVAKQKSTLALAITLAHTDKNLSKFIINKRVPYNYYDDLLAKYSKSTLYKNIWIQVLDKHGVSIYRSWSKHHGDNLSHYREDIVKFLIAPKNEFFISVGKFDMSIKAIVPIFDNNIFIGMIEVISHFNSISKQLSRSGIDSIVVADKKYKTQLKFPVTKLFIDDYYVANYDAKPELMEYLKKNNIQNYLDSGYKIENGYFIVSYKLENSSENIGSYITFQKLDDLSLKSIKDFMLQWILFGILILMLAVSIINIILYMVLRKQKKYYQKIMNNSTNVVLINEGNQILEVNSRFFQIFNEYKTLKEFKEKYNCICEFFVEDEGYIKEEMDGKSWVEYILAYPNKTNKIKLYLNGRIYYFLISASIISDKPLRHAIVLSDITTEEIYKEELEKLTITDPLTNVRNRRYYELRIEKEVSRACRYNEKLSIILFDIDFFKKVNDEHGHDVGDKVLMEYTKLVKSMLRDTDELCRIGGEEFVIIATHTSQIDTYVIAEKIRKAIEEHHMILPITVSFGVAEYKDCESKDSFFKRADNALYEAKKSGRNRVVLG
ncbi:diguanylate cyclase [Sulfurimonas sp.]|uniref:diguanylate cyclase n=1 Tax=Sulfurimonas sp. TaxID=2022749 RepID=UPI00262BA993|nr:diguanylate cyclase [Sulfurimonas sp.]